MSRWVPGQWPMKIVVLYFCSYKNHIWKRRKNIFVLIRPGSTKVGWWYQLNFYKRSRPVKYFVLLVGLTSKSSIEITPLKPEGDVFFFKRSISQALPKNCYTWWTKGTWNTFVAAAGAKRGYRPTFSFLKTFLFSRVKKKMMLKLLFSFLLRADTKKRGWRPVTVLLPAKKAKKIGHFGGLYGPKRFFSFCGNTIDPAQVIHCYI